MADQTIESEEELLRQIDKDMKDPDLMEAMVTTLSWARKRGVRLDLMERAFAEALECPFVRPEKELQAGLEHLHDALSGRPGFRVQSKEEFIGGFPFCRSVGGGLRPIKETK